MNDNKIAAIKLTNKNSMLSSAEICDIHKDWSLNNEGRVLFTTNTRFKAELRNKIDRVLFFVDPATAYLVNVVAIGPGYPNTLTRIPEGFSTPTIWKDDQRNSWMALEGNFELVQPNEFALDSAPDTDLVQNFATARSSHAYVHRI